MGWIKQSEKFPPLYKSILVAYYLHGGYAVEQAYAEQNGNIIRYRSKLDDSVIGKVVAWMPMPEFNPEDYEL